MVTGKEIERHYPPSPEIFLGSSKQDSPSIVTPCGREFRKGKILSELEGECGSKYIACIYKILKEK